MNPTIEVQVPGSLRVYCKGASALLLAAPTVRAALGDLEQNHAALHRNICDETGKVRQHINIFINTDNTRDLDNGLDRALAPGDVVTILPAVSGG
jgi:molybdopterin converting factor small subunit